MRNCLLFLAVLFSVAAHSNVVHEERSLYRNIIVDETHDLRCLKFNTKSSQTSQSCMYKNNPDKLVFNYTKLTFASLLVTDNPKNVLIIGLGGVVLAARVMYLTLITLKY